MNPASPGVSPSSFAVLVLPCCFILHPSSFILPFRGPAMSVVINENDLPQELTAEAAVEAAYASELAEVASKLQRSLPTLIECDKDLGPYLYLNLRNRLRSANLRCLYLDGRPRQEDQQQGATPMGMMGTMIA